MKEWNQIPCSWLVYKGRFYLKMKEKHNTCLHLLFEEKIELYSIRRWCHLTWHLMQHWWIIEKSDVVEVIEIEGFDQLYEDFS